MELSKRRGQREGPAWLLAAIILLLAGLSAYFMIRDRVEPTGPGDAAAVGRAPDNLAHAVTLHGGLLHEARYQALVDSVAERLVGRSFLADAGVRAEIHVLAARDTATSVVVPGGHVLVTRALVDRLRAGDGLAGLLAHQLAHVLVAGAAEEVESASGDSLVVPRYSSDEEVRADRLALRVLEEAGYEGATLPGAFETLHGTAFLDAHPWPPARRRAVLRWTGGGGPEPDSSR